MPRMHFEAEHHEFRDSVRRYAQNELGPQVERWRKQGFVDREAFLGFGAQGYLLMWADEQLGGLGLADMRYEQILQEETVRFSDPCFYHNLHSMIIAPYIARLGSQAQRERYLPRAASGECILAIAMTEPDAGSDLAAIRTRAELRSGHWVLNGAKTYISNGTIADAIVVAARTGDGPRELSLFVVEADDPGFSRGRRLAKLGLHGQDTAELFFREAQLPGDRLLGEAGAGFRYLTSFLPVERLQVAIGSMAHAQTAFDLTLDYVAQRRAFGQSLGQLQSVRFSLAQLRAELDMAQCFVDQCVVLANRGALDTVVASQAKLLATELEGRTIDACLQLHGGAGYMDEYRISRMYADARVSRIFAGANEIMKEIIGRSLELGAQRSPRS
ncbi:MAG: acyl-CoA dehydrogenase family protein [Burkholderiaceae bacterium]